METRVCLGQTQNNRKDIEIYCDRQAFFFFTIGGLCPVRHYSLIKRVCVCERVCGTCS